MQPVEFAKALEQRGFDSLWAPEHSHIPTSRNSPFPQGGDLPSKYYDVMDPFVSLTAAASVTSELKIATGICLVIQRDPIQLLNLLPPWIKFLLDDFFLGLEQDGMQKKWQTMELTSKQE